MHVEVSVALNFLISYLYNKLPRRRVDLFGEELEKGLKKKFAGHWYPDKPFKGSGFRCVRCNGENVDPVIKSAVLSAGLDLDEVKQYIPEEMTLWIDPSEVSYRISEKAAIKVLYTDRPEDDGVCDTADREVQVTNHTFNPEALSFQPIHPLSSSLSSLSLSPSSPQPPPGTWSTSVSPSSSLFSSPMPTSAPVFLGPPSAASSTPKFTAATFAATKFGSTKLKSQAKRPTRLSPTHLGHYFRHQHHQHQQQQQQQPQQQQQQPGMGIGCGGGSGFGVGVGVAPSPSSSSSSSATSPQRPRSLSPRDPRLEFLLDKQTRAFPRGQLSPSSSSGFASSPSSSSPSSSFAHHSFQSHPQFSHELSSPGSSLPFSLAVEGSLQPSPSHLSPNRGHQPSSFADMLAAPGAGGTGGMHSPASSLSPDAPKSFVEGLQHLHGFPGAGTYPGSSCYPGGSSLQHLLVAN